MSAKVILLMGNHRHGCRRVWRQNCVEKYMAFTAMVLIFLNARVDWKLTMGFGLAMTAVGTTA
jgi:hypothetical protein